MLIFRWRWRDVFNVLSGSRRKACLHSQGIFILYIYELIFVNAEVEVVNSPCLCGFKTCFAAATSRSYFGHGHGYFALTSFCCVLVSEKKYMRAKFLCMFQVPTVTSYHKQGSEGWGLIYDICTIHTDPAFFSENRSFWASHSVCSSRCFSCVWLWLYSVLFFSSTFYVTWPGRGGKVQSNNSLLGVG